MNKIDRLLFLQAGKCFYCDNELRAEDANVEHLLAKTHGGNDSDANCVAVCKHINTVFGSTLLSQKIKIIMSYKGKIDCPQKQNNKNIDNNECYDPFDPTNFIERINALTGKNKTESEKRKLLDSINEIENSTKYEEMWSWFLQMIAKPNTINGRDERFRVAFKDANQMLYFNEIKVRTALATEFFQDPVLAEYKKGDGRAVITERLLKVLDDKGVLIKSWQDFHFGYKGALFKLGAFNKNGKKLGEWATAFIVDLKEHLPDNVRALDPAPNPPRIVEPVFPQRSLQK